MRVKICDTNFEHIWYMGGERGGYLRSQFAENPCVSKYGIEWYRGDDYFPTCFFSDNTLALVDEVRAERKVAMIMEPPALLPKVYRHIADNYKKFDYVLTYDEELSALDPQRFLWWTNAVPMVHLPDRQIYPKTELVSMIASEKRWLPGHKLRGEIISRFGSQLAVFGGPGFADRYTPEGSKLPWLKNYMFTIAVLNSKCDNYYTEIITDAMATGTIPIFWGTHAVSKHFNADGIIFFDTLDELADILPRLGPDLYNSKIEAVTDNYQRVNRCRVPEDVMYEQHPHLFEDAI
jgi:hypothetical protein